MLVQSLAYVKDAPGATPVLADPVSGDSLTLRAVAPGMAIKLIDWMLCSEGAAGEHRLIWTTGHDTSYGLAVIADTEPRRVRPVGRKPATFASSEVIKPYVAGSATAGEAAFGVLQILYDSVPGAEGQYISPEELLSRGLQPLGWIISITHSAKLTWTAGGTLDQARDVWKRDKKYAILGAKMGSNIVALALRGPDTGNVRLAVVPERNDRVKSLEYFVDLSLMVGKPCIPVIEGANVGATQLEFLGLATSGSEDITLYCVELD